MARKTAKQMINKALLVAPAYLLVLISLFAVAGSNHIHLDVADLTLLAMGLLAGFTLFFLLVWRCTADCTAAAKALTYFSLLWLFFIFFAVSGMHYLKARYDVLMIYGMFAALAGLLLWKRKALPFTREMQMILLVFFLITISLQLKTILKISGSSRQVPLYTDVEDTLPEQAASSLPHVVYIVPDRYASNEALRDFYGYDNSGFSAALEARGFHVWERQFSNYPKTFQSMAATLNMNYLDSLADQLGPEETSYVPVYRLINNSQTLRVLRRNGYGYVHMGGQLWEPTRTNRQADHHVTHESAFGQFTRKYLSVTPAAFLNTLAGDDMGSLDVCSLISRQAETIVEMGAQSEKPLFFFWHLFSIHEPFLYDENGACRDSWQYGSASPREHAAQYLHQINATNTMLLDVFDRLRSQSKREIIFMIVSDEGPRPWNYLRNENLYEFLKAPNDELRQKFAIYNAIYLPSGNYENFAAEQTSINAFRLTFNEIFAADLPLHEHKSYSFNRQALPYALADITSRLRQQESGP